MSAKEVAFQRDARGVCIICEDDKSPRRRGLCIKHYTRYMTSRKEFPEELRNSYDDFLVPKGLLMPSQQGRRVDPNDNEFAIAAQEFALDAVERATENEKQMGGPLLSAEDNAALSLAAKIKADAEADQEENPRPGKPAGKKPASKRKK